jgi:hypothetical protein
VSRSHILISSPHTVNPFGAEIDYAELAAALGGRIVTALPVPTTEGGSGANHATLATLRAAMVGNRADETQIVNENPAGFVEVRWRAPDARTLVGLSVTAVGALSTTAGAYDLTARKGAAGSPLYGGVDLLSADIACEDGGDLTTLTDTLFSGGSLTGTGADLIFAAGDWMICRVTSDNGDLAGGGGLWVTPIWSV